jgi:epoxide hydrolase 4
VHPVISEDDLRQYQACWDEPGCIRGMLAWYRALVGRPWLPAGRKVTVPTHIVWGKQDHALGFELAGASAERCEDVRLTVVEDSGHFVQHDAAERVRGILAEWLPG